MFPSTDLLAWSVMIIVSIVGGMLMIRVIRSALGARRAAAAIEAAADRFVQSDDYKFASLLNSTAAGTSRRSMKFLSEVAAGQIEAIPERVKVFVDSEFGTSSLRGVNACARMLPFAGLFGTVLGLLAQFSMLGDGDGKNLDLSAVGLALRTTAAALFGTMALLAVSSFVGEPALRRIRNAYMQAAYVCHDHCQFLRDAFRAAQEMAIAAPVPIPAQSEPPPAPAGAEKSRKKKQVNRLHPEEELPEDSPIYEIKPASLAWYHGFKQQTA